jgi:2-dehydro-3-deoxygluconokinase
MVRLSTPIGQTLETAPSLSTHVGGAELNGLIAATAFGMPSTWVSAVGDDIAGRRIARHARSHGVTTALQITDDARSGLYFVEMAAYPRSTRVFYDRKWSAASFLDRGVIDWSKHVTPRTCFYSSGVTAGISSAARGALEEAINDARALGAFVAFDINYRRRLWPADQAYAWVDSVISAVDILSVSRDDLLHLGQSIDDLEAARIGFGVNTLVVSAKERTPEAVTVKVTVIDEGGLSEATGEAAIIDPFGAGDAMFGAFLATAPTRGRQAAVEQALKAGLITYGIHGDAMDADPTTTLDQGRILR